ncbi:MAG: CoA-binding protein [bacterium]|nr:CoA-binding protein [bacterium]
MRLFFEPKTVAEFGASTNSFRPGNHLAKNLKGSFGDNFYPINPKESEILDLKCYPNLLEIPVPIDVAIIFIPAASVPEALEQCAKKGVKRVVIESAGFAEVGERGRELTRQCLEIAKKNGIRIWGPNCMGPINVTQSKMMSFMIPGTWEGRFTKGGVSMVVQSGMLSAGFLLHVLSRTPFGLSKICSVGNKMDVDEVDLLEYFIQDPDTEVISMYLESLPRGRRFCELAKSTRKPIVVLKSGRTEYGSKAASSHTASMAQDDRVLDAAFRQAGIIRAKGMHELLDVSRCLGVQRMKPVKKARIAVVTFSGGAGVVTADDIKDYGMELAKFSPETMKKIKTVFPEWMDPENPVDLYPAIEKLGPIPPVNTSLEAAMADPGVDAVYAHLFASVTNEHLFDLDFIGALIKKYNKPLVLWMLGDATVETRLTAELESKGIPTATEIAKGVRLLAALTMKR